MKYIYPSTYTLKEENREKVHREWQEMSTPAKISITIKHEAEC